MNLFQDTFPSPHLMAADSSRALVASGGGGGKKFVPTYVPCTVCETLVVQKPGMHLILILIGFVVCIYIDTHSVILILML